MARVRWSIVLWLSLTVSSTLSAQDIAVADTTSLYPQRAERLVSFLEYMLNTVGSTNTSTRDKDVIITQSYAKVFRDSEVQVEDDLLEDRQVITNKDVIAYLKDIEFFFRDVSFEFNILDITEEVGEDDQLYLKVHLERHLVGLTVDGDSVDNRQPRFIEININEEADELKIVSIYTTKISRDQELLTWWNSLSFQWTSIFLSKLGSTDSVTTSELYQLIDMDSLDLSNNSLLVDLSPLQLLDKLEHLNINNVQAGDFSPLRYLGKLKSLHMSGCGLTSFEPLKYAVDIEELDLSRNPLTDSLDWSMFSKVKHLNITEARLNQYAFLVQLPQLSSLDLRGNNTIRSMDQLPLLPSLTELDLSQTRITSLEGIGQYPRLQSLTVASTPLSQLGNLASLNELRTLDIQNTRVKELTSLNAPNLEYIQADNSQISQLEAARYMSAHPNALVVVNTRENELWWRGLSPEWKTVLTQEMDIGSDGTPDLEQIIRLFNITELDVSGNPISDASALSRFNQLQKLDISTTEISSLSFCRELTNLMELRTSGTRVNSLIGLENHPSLKILDVSTTGISQLHPLTNISTLEEININNTSVKSEIAMLWQVEHPDQLLLFQSSELKKWWEDMSANNQAQMKDNLAPVKQVGERYLHRLVKSERLQLSGRDIKDLALAKSFYNLRSLELTETQITSFVGIEQFSGLEALECSKSPLYDINSIIQLKSLKALSIQDTPIDDLSPFGSLKGLQSLNVSGTNIKNLKGLETIRSLKVLDCSNTQVRNLSPLSDLRSLEELTCYNTRLNNKSISSFRESHPRCRVNYY